MPERRVGNMNQGPAGGAGDAGKPGTNGEAGVSYPLAIAGTIQLGTHNQLALLASSRQLAMVLHSAEMSYLNEDYSGALDRLLWTYKMTDTVLEPGGTAITPLVKLDDPILSGRIHAEMLAQIKERAVLLIQQMRSGLDYYGFVPQYVELVDKAFYDSYLEVLLDVGKEVEQRQEQFWNIRNDIGKVKTALTESLNSLQRLQGTKERELELIGGAMTKLQNEIAVLNQDIANLQVQVQMADQSFKDAVERQSAGCSFNEVLGVITTIVSVATAVYTAGTSLVALGGAVSAFSKASDLTKDQVAALVDKDLAKYKVDSNIITVVKQVGSTADSIGKGYKEIEKFLASADDNRAKLVLTKEEYAKTLEPFMSMPEAQTLKALLNALFGAIESRNNKCVEYTAGRLREDLVRNEMAKAKIEAALVSVSLAGNNNEEILSCSSLLDAALWRLKLQIIKGLYLSRKSIELYGLKEVKLTLHDKTIANLNAARADLKTSEQEIVTQRGQAHRVYNPIKIEFNMGDAKSLLEGLISKGSAIFTIPANHPAFSTSMREIRASKLRIWLNGINPPNKKISILARHEGNAKFTTVGGRQVEFVHRPRPHFWKYDTTNPSAPDTSPDLGGESGLFVDISPFGTWTLRLDAGDNTPEDLEGLTSVVFEFEGTFLPTGS